MAWLKKYKGYENNVWGIFSSWNMWEIGALRYTGIDKMEIEIVGINSDSNKLSRQKNSH